MITVLYHNDADGFGAAYALWEHYGNDACYIPVQYGQPVPKINTTELFIVDFSYDKETTQKLIDRFGYRNAVIIDHHKSASEELKDVKGYVTVDESRAGCILVWQHLFGKGLQPPDILRYVEDRDLWKFELPDSKEVNAYIFSLPEEFEVWRNFELSEAVSSGRRILAFQANQVDKAVKNAREMIFFGFVVPTVNCQTNISEVGHRLLDDYPDAKFAVMYFVRADGKYVYSFRSRGDLDVGELARAHGGGGHKASAGMIGFDCGQVPARFSS